MERERFRLPLAAVLFGAALLAVALFGTREEEEAAVSISGPAPDVTEEAMAVSPESVESTIRTLASYGSRTPGYPGSEKAYEFITGRFESLGLKGIETDEFPVVVPMDRGGELTCGDRSLELYSLWPNLLRTCTTPPEGLGGQLIYGGRGHLNEFNRLALDGTIVLLDFDSSTRWLNSAMLGAKAVVFIGSSDCTRTQAAAKFVELPLNFPRYWADGAKLYGFLGECLDSDAPPEDLLGLLNDRDVRAVLRGRTDFVEAKGRNITATIPGSDPDLVDEPVVIQAYYDSVSVVPALAPGAEAACGIAALLEIAEEFSRSPPRRPVELLATDAHFLAMAGMRRYASRFVAERKELEKKKTLEERRGRLLFSLDLASHTREVGLFYKAHFYDQSTSGGEERIASEYAELGELISSIAEGLRSSGAGVNFVNAIRPKGGWEWRNFLYEPTALESEAWSTAGEPGLCFYSTRDTRIRIDTPSDTPEGERVDYDALAEQAGFVLSLLRELLSAEELPSTQLPKRMRALGDSFCRVVEDNLVSYLPSQPVEDGVASARIGRAKTLRGIRGATFVFTRTGGRFEIPGMYNGRRGPFACARLDPRTGGVYFISEGKPGSAGWNQRSIRGRIVDRKADWDERPTDQRYSIFPCVSTTTFELVDQLYFTTLRDLTVMDAKRNAEPRNLAVFTGETSAGTRESEPVAMIFTRKEVPIKVTLSSGLTGKRMLLLNSDPENPEGKGYAPELDENILPFTSYMAARDMWTLDESRMKELKRHGISNAHLEELHEAAGRALERARLALEARSYDEFLDESRAAWGLEEKVYPEVVATTHDVVKGVIFYFMILLPFSIFAERLFFGAVDIRARLILIGLIFAGFYGVLYVVHPAFRISRTPIIILLGFLMAFLALVVMAVILSKFHGELIRMREKEGVTHRADVSRWGAVIVSLDLGAQNMRKRPMRTFLTCLTLVLLMFTVLSFTSFSTVTAYNVAEATHRPAYQGILVRRIDWGAIERHAAYAIDDHFSQFALVSRRAWLTHPNPMKELSLDVRRSREMERGGLRETVEAALEQRESSARSLPAELAERETALERISDFRRALEEAGDDRSRLRRLLDEMTVFPARAAVGLEAHEDEFTRISRGLLPGGRFFREDETASCILSARAAAHLGVGPGEEVVVLGERLEVVGVLSRAAFARARDLDGDTLAPVDYVKTLKRWQEEEASRQRSGAQTQRERMVPEFLHMDPDGVVFLPRKLACKLGAEERSVAVKVLAPEEMCPGASLEEQVKALAVRGGLALRGKAVEPLRAMRRPETVRAYAERLPKGPVSAESVAGRVAAALSDRSELRRLYEEMLSKQLVRDFVRRSMLIVHAGVGDKSLIYSARSSLTVGGLGQMIAPLAIASLIVLNVMMGAVYERLREIRILTSVGLAPLHISFLFLAESCAYATTGSVFGYLLGQIIAKLVTTFGLFQGIAINYSSTSAVFATVIVGAVVLASTAFPMWKAAVYAVPDETRRLRLPEPEGDLWEFEFPFTAPSSQVLGLNMFLYDFFRLNDEDTTGRFSSFEVGLAGSEEEIRLSARVWLMPLDMGISQEVELLTTPTPDEPLISRIYVRIRRLTGEIESWRRMNKGFLAAARKQFLIWRLVKDHLKQEYAERARKTLAGEVSARGEA